MNPQDLYIKVNSENETAACYWDNYAEEWRFTHYLRPVTEDELRELVKDVWEAAIRYHKEYGWKAIEGDNAPDLTEYIKQLMK